MIRLGFPMALTLVPFLVACASARGPGQGARAELAPTGTLRVAVFTGNPVLGARDRESGRVSGTTASIGQALAAEAGVAAQIIEYTSVAKLMEDAAAGAWDITVVAYDPARRNIVDFAPAHIAVDLTYLVAPGQAIVSVAEADRPGVNIAAARGAATTLLLERSLKEAKVLPAENEPAAFALLRDGRAQAYAQNRYMLLGLSEKLPGSRVLDDRFAVAEMSIALPKGRPEALAYVGGFVEQAKKSGVVQRAIDSAGLRGVKVAPPTQ
jgi:polar amino acid transport system substrate-binding protein